MPAGSGSRIAGLCFVGQANTTNDGITRYDKRPSSVVQRDAGVWTTFIYRMAFTIGPTLPSTIDVDQWFKMRLIRIGNYLTYYIDDQAVMGGMMETGGQLLTSVNPGIYAYNPVNFRNIKAWTFDPGLA
jgi:hypothetical protein